MWTSGNELFVCLQLYGKPIRVNKASAHTKNLDVGANIFIGNLDPEVDEKLLYDTFSAFGVILQTPKVGGRRFGLKK
jgi:splicing factor 3B subunit 4